MIKAVIFDLNGVFLESIPFSERFEKKFNVPEQVVYSAVKEVLAEARKPGLANSFKLWQPYLKKWGLKLSKAEFFTFWFSGERVVPELLEYSQDLRRSGVKVYILSNNFRERTEYYRRHFPEIFQDIDGAYFSWETGFVKPDREAIKNVLATNSLQPNEVLYFDDSLKNIEAAKELGIKAYEYKGLLETTKEIEASGVQRRGKEQKY